VGYTAPRGLRNGLGALHLAFSDGGQLIYAGRVGTGMNERQLQDLSVELSAKTRSTAPCTGALPGGRGHFWVEPELVCEVRYHEITDDGLLRQPVLLRLRDDKPI